MRGPWRVRLFSVLAGPMALATATLAGEGPLLRVGLSVGSAPQFPELGRRFWLRGQAGEQVVRGPLTVRAQPPEVAAQVGAFTQETYAQSLAVRLQAQGLPVERVEEGGLTRLLVPLTAGLTRGQVQRLLGELGVEPLWVQRRPGMVEVEGGEGGVVRGEVVEVRPVDPLPVAVGKRRYRGVFFCLAGGKGPVVVNQVELEEYLLGVVPAEMGPRQFPQLEALKAQAVAARSYALAQRGAHGAEGFDLCDAEHCQVYAGVDAEEPLSSQAVAETRGMVLRWAGSVVRAYFHSTCGGHTEAAATVFLSEGGGPMPGVPCQGEKVSLGRGKPTALRDAIQKLRHIAKTFAQELGAHTPLELARAFGGFAGHTVTEALGLPDFSPLWPGRLSWNQVISSLPLPSPSRAGALGKDAWVDVLQLGQLAGAVQVWEGVVAPGTPGPVFRPTMGPPRSLETSQVVWAREGGWWHGEGEALAGSRAWLWCAGEVCPVVEVEVAASADERSSWRGWVRQWRGTELAAKVGLASVGAVRVLQRTPTGRVGLLELEGAGIRQARSGAEIRRLLGLPSTWFVVGMRREGADTVFRFFGKGWGHGVGLCQNGAYGLALGGWTFHRILAHYYPGAELSQSSTTPGEGGP
ncbi:MAG: SpoIID/LytB domain-containing protein [Thermoanaerobaculum sp.]|nr:SpoIID/LytB domain-containing protein [Thermoanaerobaculum sp.]